MAEESAVNYWEVCLSSSIRYIFINVLPVEIWSRCIRCLSKSCPDIMRVTVQTTDQPRLFYAYPQKYQYAYSTNWRWRWRQCCTSQWWGRISKLLLLLYDTERQVGYSDDDCGEFHKVLKRTETMIWDVWCRFYWYFVFTPRCKRKVRGIEAGSCWTYCFLSAFCFPV